MRTVYFITHPDVIIDRTIPVPQWSLSERGLTRMNALLKQPWVTAVTSIYCSTEQKAMDGAQVLAHHLALPLVSIEALGENDRSATGFLEADEFEAVADQFFAHPYDSIRGWETAAAAQQRIVLAVHTLLKADRSSGAVAIISHGAVGTLLLCKLAGYPIDRTREQPGHGGGNFFAFNLESERLLHGWKAIDEGQCPP